MKVFRIVPGFVSQAFDTEAEAWVDQDFIGSDDVDVTFETESQDPDGDWVDEYGNKIENPKAFIPEDAPQPPLLDMVQPRRVPWPAPVHGFHFSDVREYVDENYEEHAFYDEEVVKIMEHMNEVNAPFGIIDQAVSGYLEKRG